VIVELRQYTLHPGRRDELIELFERELVEPQRAAGMSIDGTFRDRGRDDVFVWIRSFPDMAARRASLQAFYGGPIWRAHRDAANATMIDSDNVLLLAGDAPKPRRITSGPLFGVLYPLADRASLDARVIGAWTTELSENTFPQLPVRGGECVWFALVDGGDRSQLAATNPAQLLELEPTAGSRIR
jgi:hypothetical protein